MNKYLKLFSMFLLFCFGACVANPVETKEAPEPIFSIDFRKPIYKTSHPCLISHDERTEFNPTCGRSWKLDRYSQETDEFSFIEIEVELAKDNAHEYVIELLQCQRKDPPFLSRMSITVNDQTIVQNFQAYNGPNNIHYPDEAGNPWHLRWDVFEITNELQNGTNKIRVSLDKDTTSGISMSWLHIRPSPK